MKQRKKGIISSLLAVILALTSIFGTNLFIQQQIKANAALADAALANTASADTTKADASITGELTGKRTKFVKQFAMTDGSYTAVTYSIPVHYKKAGKWKEIDTTLVKSGSKDLKKNSSSPANYKTKATDLSIKVSKKANKKSLVSMKRGKTSLSIALKGKKLKAAKANVNNPKKKAATDVRNQNKVTYKKVMKNTNISYDIFPEKVQEIVSIRKKQKNKALSFKLNTRLKAKVKGKKIYFKTKKGVVRQIKRRHICHIKSGLIHGIC